MPTRRRSDLEVYRDLLFAIRMNAGPIKPTRLMYAANVGWTKLQDYIDTLAEKQLIRELGVFKDKRSSTLISLTEKGLLVLRIMTSLFEYLTDESDPDVNPPPEILRWLARHLTGKFELEKIPLEEVTPMLPLLTPSGLEPEEDVEVIEISEHDRYECTRCDKTLYSLHGYKIHLKRVHGVKYVVAEQDRSSQPRE